MIEVKIDTLSAFLSSLVMLAVTLLWDQIAVGVAIAAILFPAFRRIVKTGYKKSGKTK